MASENASGGTSVRGTRTWSRQNVMWSIEPMSPRVDDIAGLPSSPFSDTLPTGTGLPRAVQFGLRVSF